MNIPEIQSQCEQLVKRGEDQEKVIAFMRSHGCPKALSINIIAKIYGKDRIEAKKDVHYSETWADTKQSDEEWQDSLEEQ